MTFFTASDGIVNENLSSNFATEVTLPEACCFYGFQIAVENIHSETYLLLIDMFIKDPTKKMHLLQAIETVPLRPTESTVGSQVVRHYHCQLCQTHGCIRHRQTHLLFRVFLCHLLAQETWPDARTQFSNELISRDEGLHCNFACLLYSKLVNRLPELRIVEIIRSAIKLGWSLLLAPSPLNCLE